jgi:2-polyprenyl-6-methoxyphenol hydroxylase-like FAD-dependent oxidoreductase
MYDAIIVGARCGGSPLAMQLARKGHNVLVVDRAHFPSDTLSTHALTADAAVHLTAWGLLDRVTAADGRPVTNFSRHFCQGQEVRIPGFNLAPRRTVLDNILVEASREAGAEVREGASVVGLIRDDGGRVTGVRLQSEGAISTEQAGVVVGADGRNSYVARTVGAEIYNEQPPLSMGYYSYFADYPLETIEVHWGDGLVCFAFPTSDGLACLAVERHHEHFPAFRADTDGEFRKAHDAVGLGGRYARSRRVEEWRGAVDLPNHYRKPFGAGWALVGDAGYVKDPILGMGVNDAFRDAELLSVALDRVFRGEADFDSAMGAYQQERDARTAQMFMVNYEFSKLAVTTAHLEQLRAGAAARMEAAGVAAAE